MLRRPPVITPLATEMTAGLDEAIATLRYCRKHMAERQTPESLRLVKSGLGGLALAIDAEMQGERELALRALERIRSPMTWDPYDPNMPPGC